MLSNKDFGNLVRTSASKNATIIANVKINNIECIDNDILLIYVNTELRGMQNIKVDRNSKAIINTIIYTENKFEVIQFKIYQHITKLFYNLPDQQIILEPGKKLGTFDNPILINAINKIPPIISPVSSENFGKPVQYSRTLISLYSKVLLNYKYADKGDILAIYVGTELRGKIEVQKKNKMSIASGMIYSSGVKEKITFRLYNKKLNAVVLVPELFFEVTAGSSVGSFNNPVTIRAIGKLPYTIKDIFNYYLPNTSIVEPTSKEIGVNTNITYVDNSGNNVCSGCDTNNLCLFCSTCKTCESTQICYNCKTSSSCASCNLCNYCNTCNTCGESNICTNCNKCKSCGNCDCSSNSSTNNTNTSNPITTSNPTNTTSVVVNVDLSGLSVDSSGGGSGSGSGSGSGVPQKAPVLASVTPIGTTLDRTPSFTFSSDESGTIASSLPFGSVNRAIVGNNVITFTILNLGNYTDATLSVTDSDGNVATLAIPSFSIVAEPQDLRAPILTSVTPIGETTNKSPSFVFTSDEAGTITSDLSFFTTNQAIIGENTITFTNLSPNVYTGRTVSVTDASGNKGSLIIPAFSIEFVDDVGPTLTLLSGIGDTKDTTPSITFLSDDTGTLTSNLDFTSSNIVEVGTNIVNFSELTEGTYTNKSISVTDASGNINTLAIPVFRIDTSGPVLQVVVPIGTTSDRTPTFIFSSSEPGIISSNTNFTSTISAVSGNNSITFTQLEFGTYTGVNVKVTDAGGSFTTLSVPSFTITGNDFVIESAQQIAFLDFYNRLKLRSFQKTKPTSVVGTGRGVSGLGNSLGNVSAF